MNIVFFHANGIVPTAGGISRTTDNLCRLFRSRGHCVWFCGCQDKHLQVIYDKQQFFLPDAVSIASETNTDYLCTFCCSNDIHVIINQSPFSEDMVSLLAACREKCGVKVLSCYHNSILTPVIRYAYQKEFYLKLRNRGWLFTLLKSSFVSKFLVKGYIWKYRKIFRKTIKLSDALIVLCKGQEDELLRMCGYQHCEKVNIIPNCMPYDTLSSETVKKKIVLWVGTFDYAIKRPDLMLKVWKRVSKRHPDWSLLMLGDGPSHKLIKDSSNSMGLLNIEFMGRINPETYYEEASILCMTSVHEAFPMVPLEAMSHSVPVLAFNSFTSASMIINEGENGMLVRPFDLNDYSKSLELLMDNESLRLAMGKNARCSVEQYSEENIYSKWQCVFENL